MKILVAIVLPGLVAAAVTSARAADLGLFTASQDIGGPAKAGSALFDAATGKYTVTGGGANIWAKKDAFQYLFKKVSGDVSFSATVHWPDPSITAHRKACLMIRESLDPDSPYVDVVQHGVGMTALQCRDTKGDITQEIISTYNNPTRVGIVKRGDYISFWMSTNGEELHPAGGSYRLPLQGSFYVGFAVSAHDDNRIEKAEFTKVDLAELPPVATNAAKVVESTLEIMPVTSNDRTIVWHTNVNIQAPNWTKDNLLIFNGGGKLYRIGITNGTSPELLNITGPNLRDINNDHSISPDGTRLAISAGSTSRVYVGPIGGGVFTLITSNGPSYLHGWSPDGSTLAFAGKRPSDFDIYTIPATGGKETQLTTTPGVDDGPQYSPDGKYIYFNSERSGLMQIWRMKPDGSEQTQITPNDGHNNWFAHISPDGTKMAFLSFGTDIRTGDHPANKDVAIRMKPVEGGTITTLVKCYGGQGTMNVDSWSPDSRKIAFVTYTTVYPKQ